MKIEQYFESIQKIKVDQLQSGSSKTIDDFYNSCIKNTLSFRSTIIAWDDILNKYIREPDSIYFIRKYASAPNKNWNDIRRGFYTRYRNNFGYVFCDNYFAHYFYIMAMDNFVPDYTDFKNFILNRKIPYGFMETSEEKPYRAFEKGKIVNINKAGWKLAHIFSVNGNDYTFPYKEYSKVLFPLGVQSDWNIQQNFSYPFRYIDYDISAEDRNKMKAHFMRLVHPMNYFLVPMQKYEIDEVNNNIGEYDNLIKFMYLLNRNIYQDIFDKYQDTILYKKASIIKNIYDIGKSVINVKYGFEINKSSSTPIQINSKSTVSIKQYSHYSDDIVAKIIYSYLVLGKSYRKIEIEDLNLDSPVRGGGYIAMKIIHDYSIGGEKKGAINNENITDEISKAEGSYLQALQMIKKIQDQDS